MASSEQQNTVAFIFSYVHAAAEGGFMTPYQNSSPAPVHSQMVAGTNPSMLRSVIYEMPYQRFLLQYEFFVLRAIVDGSAVPRNEEEKKYHEIIKQLSGQLEKQMMLGQQMERNQWIQTE